MTPLTLLLHFKLLTVIFFFKTKFSIAILAACMPVLRVYLCPQNPEEGVDSLEAELQMGLSHHVAESLPNTNFLPQTGQKTLGNRRGRRGRMGNTG